MLLATLLLTIALTTPIPITAIISSPFLVEEPQLQDAEVQTSLPQAPSPHQGLPLIKYTPGGGQILSNEDVDAMWNGARVIPDVFPDSPPYQPAPTPTFSEDE